MAKKLSSVLGIDIGSHSIKICEVKASANNATVSAVGVVNTPEGSVDETGVYNSEAVGTVLKQLLASSGASSSSAVVSIAGQQSVLVRIFDIDDADNADNLKSQVDWEISRNANFADSNIMSDFKPLKSVDPDSKRVQVVAAMAPHSAIDVIVDCIKRSGRKPYAIDVQPLGLGRSIAMSLPEYVGASGICVVDLGHTITSINIYANGNLVLPRPVGGLGRTLTGIIANTMQIGEAEAEDYKSSTFTIPSHAQANSGMLDPFSMNSTQAFSSDFNPGGYEPATPGAYNPGSDATVGMMVAPSQSDDLAIDPITGMPIEAAVDAVTSYTNDPFAVVEEAGEGLADVVNDVDPMMTTSFDPFGASSAPASVSDDPAYAASAEVFEDLVSEVQRSVDYYTGQGGSVSRIILCGGGSRLRGLEGYIQRSLNISTEIYDPLKNLGFAAKKVTMEGMNEYRHQLAVAIGNGLHIMFD